jgi:peptidoglycan/xylan/chitin deacetylase (PgdA/CDA1 family)
VSQRYVLAAALAAFLAVCGAAAATESCPGNPDAIGTSRVIAVDPTEHTRVGTMQYVETLPLADHEVVLTFDDGPLPPHTGHILDILARNCVKATYFMVGSMARTYPEWARRVYDAGHAVGTHTQDHPLVFRRLGDEKAVREIDEGIASVQAALGPTRRVAPFFRFPGFGRTAAAEEHLRERGIMTWGADAPADDWKRIPPSKIVALALRRLERKGKGVLLLHDIHPSTVQALPELLRQLKAHGFRIVQVVPASPAHPKTVTDPDIWVYRHHRHSIWPAVAERRNDAPPELAAPSAFSFGFPDLFAADITIPAVAKADSPMVIAHAALMAADDITNVQWDWPPKVTLAAASGDDILPAPGPRSANWRGPLAPQLLRDDERLSPHEADPVGRMIRTMNRGARHRVRPGRFGRTSAAKSREMRAASWSRRLQWIR